MAGLLILSIETATGCGSVALTRGTLHQGTTLAEYTHRPDVTHSRRLLGLVDHLMQVTEVSWQDLDGIGVSLGPGSFTGLRIGLAAAKGLAMASQKPVLGALTLETLAWQCCGVEKQICCVLDARKNQVYACFYTFRDGQLISQGDALAIEPDRLVELIKEPTVLAGPGIQAFPQVFTGHPLITCIPHGIVRPQASMVGFLCADKLSRQDVVPPEQLVPYYLRASEAQVNLEKKKKTQPTTGK